MSMLIGKKTHLERSSPSLPLKPSYFCYNLLFFVFAALFCCAIQIPYFRFSSGKEEWANPTLYFILAAICLLSGVVFQMWGQRLFTIKVKPMFVMLFGVLFIGGLVGALCHDSHLYFEGSQRIVDIDDANGVVRMMSVTNSLLIAYGLFLFFTFGPSTRCCRSSGFAIAEILVLIGVVSIVYSLIFEWREYGNILQFGMRPWDYIASFQQSKNVYGLYLLVSIFAEMYLMEIDGRRIRYVVMAIFIAAVFFSTSKTAIIISVCSYIAYLIYRAVSLRKRGGLSIKGAIIPICILLVYVVAAVVVIMLKPNFLNSLWNAFAKFFNFGEGSSSGARLDIWSECVRLISVNPVYWVFGHGDVVYPYLLSGSMDIPSVGGSHNFVLEIIGRGGILRLVCFVFFAVYLVFCLVRKLKLDARRCFLPLLIAITMTSRQLIESVYIFDISVPSLGLMYFSIITILDEADGKTVLTPDKRPFEFKPLFAHAWGPVLALFISLLCVFIPAEYGWAYGLGCAIAVGLIVLITHLTGKSSDTTDLESSSLLFGITLMTICSALTRSLVVDIAISFSGLAGYSIAFFLGEAIIPELIVENEKPYEDCYLKLLRILETRKGN